jgi:nitronate monooxygenase
MTARDVFDSLSIPIIQAPMLGAAGVDMARAVSAAGGLGFLAGGALSGEEIVAQAAMMRRAGPAPFGINLLVTRPVSPEAEEIDTALERLAPWFDRLKIEAPDAPNSFAPDFDDQFEGLLRAAPPVASFAFDLISAERVAALKAAGSLVVGTATTVAEARAWAAAGADAICAQGGEAGGHRGEFLKPGPESLIGTMALVATVRQAVDLPVIAAGGITDGRGVAAALALGAVAAQMGTAFLLAEEATISGPWRRRIAEVGDDATAVTRAITGRNARGIETDFMRAMRPVEAEVPAYPVQNRLTRELRAAGARLGDSEVLSLWAGQAVALARVGRAGALVEGWWRQALAASDEVHRRTHGRTGARTDGRGGDRR